MVPRLLQKLSDDSPPYTHRCLELFDFLVFGFVLER